MSSSVSLQVSDLKPAEGRQAGRGDFKLYYDCELSQLTPYHAENDYLAKARDRMDRTFDLIAPEVVGRSILDVGASPFYLLFRAKALGALSCRGVYFTNDTHPLKRYDQIYSVYGAIDISHANIETDNLPCDDNSVDVLTACEILEHCEYFPFRFASEIRRVLRPGGLLCLTVPNVHSIANILKLIFQRNIYMKYRSDPTGRHKHEYCMWELEAFIGYLGMKVVKTGYMPAPTSNKFWLRPLYRILSAMPGLRRYSPVHFIVARQLDPKPVASLAKPPKALYDDVLSIES